jgi:hypothetical protein
LTHCFGKQYSNHAVKAREKKKKKKNWKNLKRGTHEKEIILYSMPVLVPICGISDICATHELTTDVKDPETNP